MDVNSFSFRTNHLENCSIGINWEVFFSLLSWRNQFKQKCLLDQWKIFIGKSKMIRWTLGGIQKDL